MTAAWEADLPLAEKAVLLCLCDHANDDGECWPSMARVARRSSMSERTAQRAIKALREKGILDWFDVPGRSHKFVINPRRIVTPDTVSPPTITTKPPTQCHPTPDTVSPKPSVTIKEPPKDNKAAMPFDVSAEVWADFQQLRKAKKAPLTPTALKAIEREAAKAGWSLQDALSECTARGWVGFKADWIKDKTNENRSARDGRDGVAKALDRRLGLGQPAGEVERYALGGSREDRGGPVARLADLR